MISVTLQFPDALAASHALARLATPEQFATATAVIAPADRPDTGAALPPAPALPDPAAAAFGGAVAQAAPLVSGTTNFNPMVAAPNATPHVPNALLTPPAAPSAPSAAIGPTVALVTVERDSTGLPWDARIHAGSKSKVASGAWTAKRNVDPGLKAQVEADLRGVPMPAAAGTPAAMVLPPAAPPVAPSAAPVPPTPPAAGAAPKTFAEYMVEVSGMFSARPVDAHNAMAAALAPHGMSNVGQLAGRPDLIPAVDAAFRAALG